MRYSNQLLPFNGKNLKQVNKTRAKKIYESGKDIGFLSSNMIYDNCWQPVNFFNIDSFLESEKDNAFNILVNEYSYYNCDAERGNYIQFFEVV